MNASSIIEQGNREFYIRRLLQEYPAFVNVCRALPPDRLDYRPHSGSRSAGELVAMLVSVQQSCLDLCVVGSSSYNSGMQWHPNSSLTSLENMVAAFELHHRSFVEKLYGLTDMTWERSAWLTRGDHEIILKDTVGGLLWMALFDSVHHRGQLSAYIRPMGGKVPSIYGPSGDFPMPE